MRTEIAASWARSAARIMPEVRQAPLADAGETRLAFAASPLSAAVRQLESQLQAAADDGELVLAVTDPAARILWTYSLLELKLLGQASALNGAAAAHQTAAGDPRAAWS